MYQWLYVNMNFADKFRQFVTMPSATIIITVTLHDRHDWQLDCLGNSFSNLTTKETSKLTLLSLCEGIRQ